MDKTKRNELLTTLADVNSLIQILECEVVIKGTTDTTIIGQLLYAYDIKAKILNNI